MQHYHLDLRDLRNILTGRFPEKPDWNVVLPMIQSVFEQYGVTFGDVECGTVSEKLMALGMPADMAEDEENWAKRYVAQALPWTQAPPDTRGYFYLSAMGGARLEIWEFETKEQMFRRESYEISDDYYPPRLRYGYAM